MQSFDAEWDNGTGWAHGGTAVCHKCLDKMCQYNITHKDPKFFPECPCCKSIKKFHYINPKNLKYSRVSQKYMKTSLLTFNTTTTKILNYSAGRYASSEGKNWGHVCVKDRDMIVNK